MMTLRTQRKAVPRRIAIYGPEGVGKSTLASMFDDPVFIDAEGSTENMDVPAWDCKTMKQVREAIKLAAVSPYRTVVFDTVDWIERALIAEMLVRDEKKSIEDYGFGKGYIKASEEMMDFLVLLDGLRAKGKHVVLLAHSAVKKVTPPESSEGYDHYEMKLTKGTSPLVKEWVDALLFLHFDVKLIRKDDKVRASGGKERNLRCQNSATADAKNRFNLPEIVKVGTGKLPAELAAIFTAAPVRAETVAAMEGALTAPAATESVPTAEEVARYAEETALAPAEESPELATVRGIIRGHEVKALAFLVGRKELKEGEGLEKLSAAYLARIATNPGHFIRAANEEQAAA